MSQDSEEHRLSRWLVSEIVSESLRTRDITLMQELLNDPILGHVEREEVLSIVFWEALRNHDWTLGNKIVTAGYPITPSDINDWGPVHECISRLGDRPEIIEWLLEQGADANRPGPSNITPLIAASQKGYSHTVCALLRRGADPNMSSRIDEDLTPLMAAASAGHESIVRHLLRFGVDTTRQDRFGRDAAYYATSHGHDTIAGIIRERQGIV